MDQLDSGKAGLVSIVLTGLYFVKKDTLRTLTYFIEHARSELRFAKELLESEKLSNEADSFIREKIEKVMFRKFYGISACAKLRKYLMSFHARHYPKINWTDLRCANLYYSFDGKKIVVSITKWDVFISRFIKIIFSLIFVVGVIAIFSSFALYTFSHIPKSRFYSFIFLGCSLIFSSIIISSSNWSYESARRIRDLLKEGG